jgi:hypothetical protein
MLAAMASGGDERDRLNREERGLLQIAILKAYEVNPDREVVLSDIVSVLKDVPLVDGLILFRLPSEGRFYVAGVDAAEGNPTSDESAVCVLDAVTGEMMAVCGGRFQPDVLAQKTAQIATFFNKADVMVCEGFTGNVMLKFAESFYDLIKRRNIQDEHLNRFNFESYGGVPVLGVSKPVIIGHGISGAKAFCNMIVTAKKMIDADLTHKIKNSFSLSI